MKESIHYWTVGHYKPVKGPRTRRLSDNRYLSLHGVLGDYSTHCMIDDQQTARDFCRHVAQERDANGLASLELVIEPVHILISCSEKKRMLKRVSDQSRQIRNRIMQSALAAL